MKKWETLCKQYADENNLPYEDVREIYLLYYKYIIDTVREYDIYANYTREDIKRQFPMFALPGIGTFYFDYIPYLRNKKEHKIKDGREVQDSDDF